VSIELLIQAALNGFGLAVVYILVALGLTPADVGAVVSGLPLLSLPRDLARGILASVALVLQPGSKPRHLRGASYGIRAFDDNSQMKCRGTSSNIFVILSSPLCYVVNGTW